VSVEELATADARLARVRELTEGTGADVVFELSGAPFAFAEGLDFLRPGGRYAVVVAEARRTLTSLALYGYRVDGVVANRVFPAGGDAWRAGWVAAQAIQLDEVEQSFAPLPVWRCEHGHVHVVGSFAELAQRTRRLAGALTAKGLRRGELVAIVGASTSRQLEAWYAVMGLGGICHRATCCNNSCCCLLSFSPDDTAQICAM